MKIDIKSIALGKKKEYNLKDSSFYSAYKKDQYYNFIEANTLGLVGDDQVDKRFHGGVDKAIHIGSNEHLKANPSFDKLSIGCNILIEDFIEDDICIGDTYSIADVLIQVTQPRQPCWKIGALFGKQVSRYISKNHATGWYVKVLQEGIINIDNKMILENRVSSLSIKELSIYLKKAPENRKIIDEILNHDAIAQSYKNDFLQTLNSNNT